MNAKNQFIKFFKKQWNLDGHWIKTGEKRGYMLATDAKFRKLRNFLYYAKNHRIPIHTETRKIGIACTLIGWACIAFVETSFSDSVGKHSNFILFFDFFIAFLAGTFWLFVASLFIGRNFLKITSSTNCKTEDQVQKGTHLSVSERRYLVFWRGVIAVVGYILYSWAKSNTQVIDNSAAFSSDAIIYALIMVFILKIKVSYGQWISVAVVFLGVAYMISSDISGGTNLWHNIFSLTVALISAACLAVIILLNTVIVQYEPPLRIAFFQCLIGLICTGIITGIWMIFNPDAIDLIIMTSVVQSVISGIIYATALIFFFTAFLYTEPFLIVMLGYSIFPFILFFSWAAGNPISTEHILGALIILVGGLSSVFLQFHQDKKNTHATISGYPVYLASLKDKFRSLKQDFLDNRLGRFEYLAQRHEFNKLLFEYAQDIKTTDIKKIEIDNSGVVFFLDQFNIKMFSDKGCRSAPLEILNFGSYEREEAPFVFEIIREGDLVLDIGAHVGWYSIQMAKRFQNIVIHAFEPIPQTFVVLQQNIQLNNLKNIIPHNIALGKSEGSEDFFYFTGGSAVASRKNLLDHEKTSRIECKTSTLDLVVSELKLERVDFIKCDVEGSELDVIQGGKKTLHQFLPVIYIELFDGWCEKFGYTPRDVEDFLKEIGYQCFAVQNERFTLVNKIQGFNECYNFFFMHPKKHSEIIKTINKK